MSGALWNEKNANAIANRRTIQGARRSMIRESLSRQTGRYVFTDGSSVAGSAKSSSNPHFGDLLYMAPTRENMDVTAMLKSLRVGTQDEPEGTQRSRASQEFEVPLAVKKLDGTLLSTSTPSLQCVRSVI